MDDPAYIEPYIKVYEYLLNQPDLNWLDILLISKIIQFPRGCWIRSGNLGDIFGIHIRTVQKKLVALQKKQWVAILPEERSNRRYVFATLKNPPAGPLFEYNENAEKAKQELRARNARFVRNELAKQLTLW